MSHTPQMAGSSGTNNCFLASQGATLFNEAVWQQIGQGLKLSPRELQITKGIFNNQKETSIADELGISTHTVHSETERLRTKLKVHDRVSLVLSVVHEYMRLQSINHPQLPLICSPRTDCPPVCPLASEVST